MIVKITSTRIPVNQPDGVYNILIPEYIGVPKGFIVYAMPSSVQPNNFDSTTTFPCISAGFGGSNTAGTGLTNACVWVSNQRSADPTSARASFGNTVSVLSRNISGSVWRQWRVTGFGENIIFGSYESSGAQQEPIDLVFTVFGGDDFFCAVGQTALPAAIGTSANVATNFRPDFIVFSHIRPAQTTDGQIHFGACHRNISSFPPYFNAGVGGGGCNWRNQDNQGSTVLQTRLSLNVGGSYNFATAAIVKINSMNNSGFAVTQSTANSGNSIIYLAMKGGAGYTEADIQNPDFYQIAGSYSAGLNSLSNSRENTMCYFGGTVYSTTFDTTNTSTASGAEMISFYTAIGGSQPERIFAGGIGTFTSSTSSTTITGVGTSFLQQFGAIDIIYTSDRDLVGIVSSIQSDTSLLLQSNANITVTGSRFEFQKPRQFSMGYGNEVGQNNGNVNFRTYFSDEAIVSFSCTGPTTLMKGYHLGSAALTRSKQYYLPSKSGPGFFHFCLLNNGEYWNRRRGGIF